MALAAICGLETFFDENSKSKSESSELNVLNGVRNLINPTELELPAFGVPEKLADIIVRPDGRKLRIDFDHGTTTLGFMYQGGIVLAVDSRATGGNYIAAQSMKKVVEINDYLLGTIAGGAADCVYWDRVLTKQCRMYELRNRERISVAAASKLMTNMVYNYKNMGLSMGMMLAGYDKRGPGLYYLDSDGTRTPGKVFSCGSGSPYAYGVLDSAYRWDLTDTEAYELGRRSITHATFRDGASGGIVRVYHMTQTGWVNITNEDCNDLYYKYQEESKQ